MINKLVGTAAVALLLATSACGSSRPSASDLSKALQNGVDVAGTGSASYPKQTADCLTGILEKSHASDTFLTAIADNDKSYRRSQKDDKVLLDSNAEAAKCLVLAP